MKENLEDILKEKMSGYAEKAPDLRKSIFEKMDARMNGEEFEGAVREKLSDYSVKAPNLLERIFSTRTAWFVLRNRFILGVEKYRYAIFTLVVGALLWSSYSEYLFNNSTDHSAVAIEEKTSAGNLEEGNAKNQTQQATVRSDVQESTEQVISGSSINTDQQVVTGTYEQERELTANESFENHSGNIVAVDDQPQMNNTVASTDNTEGDPGVNGKDIKEGVNFHVEDKPEITLIGDIASVPEQPEEAIEEEGEDEPVVTEELKTPPIRHYNFELYYSPAYAGRNLVAGDLALIDLRNSSENVKYSYGVGLRFNYELNPKWELQSGLEYNMRKEFVNFKSTKDIEEMEVTQRTVIYKDPVLPDRVVTFNDTAYNSYSVSSEQRSHNSYASITVPLLIRRTAYINQWGFYLSSGLKLSVWGKQTGYVATTSNELQDVNQGVYNERMLRPSLQIGMGAMYRVGERWALIAEPCSVYGLKPVSSGSYSLDQYDFTYSLVLGARLNF